MTYAQIVMLVVAAILIGLLLFISATAAAIRTKRGAENETLPFAIYFNGGRKTGAFALATALLGSYLSVSTFLGGPGLSYEKGLGWTYLSVIQIPVLFLTVAVVGKRLGEVSRRTNAVTVNDVLRARYESPTPVLVCSVAMAAFFVIQLAAQIKGGAILFRTITGFNYEVSLLIFGALTVLFTAFGGFPGKTAANVLFTVLAVFGSLILLALLTRASGNGNVAETMNVFHPGWDSVTGADDSLTAPYFASFWVLTGIGAIALPQTAMCGTAYRDTRALRKSILPATILLAFIVFSVHLVGTFSPLLISMAEIRAMLGNAAGYDYVIPGIILKYCNPLTAGLFFAVPLAAVLSNVNALLLSATAALLKDVYVSVIRRDTPKTKETAFRKRVSAFSILLAAVLVFAAWLLLESGSMGSASIVNLQLLAMGGLETVFFFPLVGGLYCRRGNAAGAVLSSCAGAAAYVFCAALDFGGSGFLPVVPALAVSGIAYLLGSLLGPKMTGVTLAIFFDIKK